LVLPTPAPPFCRSETAVDEGFFQIESTTAAQVFGQRLQHTAHDTGANPLLETAVAGLVRRIPLGQIGPRCAGA
jgi:hypothetical protein